MWVDSKLWKWSGLLHFRFDWIRLQLRFRLKVNVSKVARVHVASGSADRVFIGSWKIHWIICFQLDHFDQYPADCCTFFLDIVRATFFVWTWCLCKWLIIYIQYWNSHQGIKLPWSISNAQFFGSNQDFWPHLMAQDFFVCALLWSIDRNFENRTTRNIS